jgi:hypothetical protein
MAAALGSSNLARGHSNAGTNAAAKAVNKSSWADSSTGAGGSSSSKLGKGKASEQPVRGAAGTGVEADGKSAAKGTSDPACSETLLVDLLHGPVSWVLIGGS